MNELMQSSLEWTIWRHWMKGVGDGTNEMNEWWSKWRNAWMNAWINEWMNEWMHDKWNYMKPVKQNEHMNE